MTLRAPQRGLGVVGSQGGEHDEWNVGQVSSAAQLAGDLVIQIAVLLEAGPPRGRDVVLDKRLAHLAWPGREQLTRSLAPGAQLVRRGLWNLTAVHRLELLPHLAGSVPRQVFVKRIEQHQPARLVREQLREAARVRTPERMPDQQVRTRNAGHGQQLAKLSDHIARTARQRDGIAPPRAGTVIGEGRGQPGDPMLEVEVVEPDQPRSRQEDHSGGTAAAAIRRHTPAAHRVPAAERWRHGSR